MSIPKPGGDGTKDRVTVPCGKCMGCLSNLRNDWSFRLKQELKKSISSCFITLTYDDEHLVIKSLVKRDIQLFLKRLRQAIVKGNHRVTDVEKVAKEAGKVHKLRYLIVGEYGPVTNRPHYHGVMFNIPVSLKNELDRIWGLGFVHQGSVTDASIHYTTEYMINKGAAADEGIEPQFMLMSRKPGIGFNYLEDTELWHKRNKHFYVVNAGGFKQRMPRYYESKVFEKMEIEENSISLRNLMDKREEVEFKALMKLEVNPFISIEERKKAYIMNTKSKNKKL